MFKNNSLGVLLIVAVTVISGCGQPAQTADPKTQMEATEKNNKIESLSEETTALETATSEQNKSAIITIYLVRHGKTFFNTTGQVQGWADSPLTEKGIAQARAVGIGLMDIPFTTAFSSDLGRQRSTAHLILEQNQHKIPELTEAIGLREWFYGGYEGKTNAEMWTPVFSAYGLAFDEEWSQYSALTELMSDEDIANAIAANDESGMAESYSEITKRSLEAVDQIISLTETAGGGNVLVVSSGSEIPTILELLTPGQYQGEDISNCSVTIITYQNGEYILEVSGDTSYLEAGEKLGESSN